MKTIEDQFIPYNLALKLKELGFDKELVNILTSYYKEKLERLISDFANL